MRCVFGEVCVWCGVCWVRCVFGEVCVWCGVCLVRFVDCSTGVIEYLTHSVGCSGMVVGNVMWKVTLSKLKVQLKCV